MSGRIARCRAGNFLVFVILSDRTATHAPPILDDDEIKREAVNRLLRSIPVLDLHSKNIHVFFTYYRHLVQLRCKIGSSNIRGHQIIPH